MTVLDVIKYATVSSAVYLTSYDVTASGVAANSADTADTGSEATGTDVCPLATAVAAHTS